MKPFIMTLAMAIIACVASVVAWNYSPKNEVGEANTRIGEILITRESPSDGSTVPSDPENESAYDSNDIYRISIERYDRELDSPRKIEIARDRGSWVISEKNDFLASNAQRISAVLESLKQKRILAMPSDKQDDHEEYGVVEMGAGNVGGAGRTGIGTILTFEDSRRNKVAQLIIGEAADPAQRFVRIPGQPQIYVIEFDAKLLSTDFSDWVDGDLLRFGNLGSRLGEMIESLEIDYYFFDSRNLESDAARKYVYRSRIYPSGERWLYDVWPANAQQKLDEQPAITGAEINLATLGELLSEVVDFKLRDVQKKSTSAALDLAEPAESNLPSHFDWLNSRGYRHAGFANGQHQFESLAGSIRLRYHNGNVDTLSIGDLAGVDMQNRTNTNRYLLVTCGVDESKFPMPVMPKTGKTPESDAADPGSETSDGEATDAATDASVEPVPQEDDAARREYQKRLNERTNALEQANGRAKNLNQIHAEWLYVISQNTVNKLFPALDSLVKPVAQVP